MRFISIIAVLVLVSCGGSSDTGPGMTVATDFDITGIVKPLPADAAPAEQQVFRYLAYEPNSLDMTMLIYESGGSPFVHERLALLDHE